MGLGEADLRGDLPGQWPGRSEFVSVPNDGRGLVVDPQGRWMALADESIRCPVAAGNAKPPALLLVALAHPLGQFRA